MSMASPTLRSSSSTLPCPNCSSWATERWARPSTAEMLTGTSNTGARSVAVFSSPSPMVASAPLLGPNSSSLRSVSSAMSGLVGRGDRDWQGFGVQAFGGERAFQRLGHAHGCAGGIEGGGTVAPVEHEGGGGQRRLGPGDDLARITDRLGGLGQRGLQPLQQRRRRAQREAGRRFHLAGERGEGCLQRRFGEALAGRVGDLPGAGERQLRRAGAVVMGGGGEGRQGGAGGVGEIRQR